MVKPVHCFHSKNAGLVGGASGIIFGMILAIVMVGLAGCAAVVSPSAPGGTAHLQIATSSLPSATEGINYLTTLSATGGVPPYTWRATSGALPAGLQLSAATGTISGTPTSPGNYPFTALVLDAKSKSSTAGLTLNVAASTRPTISSVSPNNGSTLGGTTVLLSGNNFRVGSGVQFGNSFAASVQLVSPTQLQAVTPAEPSGTVNVTVQDSEGETVTSPNAFTFVSPLEITTSSLPVGSVGTKYSSALGATGGVPPYSWSTAGGALPAGLQLNPINGTIAGTPSAVGAFSFTAKVLDARVTSSTTGLSLNILGDPPPSIAGFSPSSGPAAGGTRVTISGANFRAGADVQFGNAAASWVMIVNPAQIQAVTPAESSGQVKVTVINSDGQAATAANGFNFVAPLEIATNALPVGTVGVAYSFSLTATGGLAPYAWSTAAGAIPAGLQLNPSTGRIAGTPAGVGTFSFTAKVQDANSTSSSSGFLLKISPDPPPTISSVSPNLGPANGGTTVVISGTNFHAADTVQVGNLLASSVQVLSATQIRAVTAPESSGVVDVTVQDSDGQVGTLPNAFTFIGPLEITTASVPAGAIGSGYSSTLTATGGVTPYSWSTSAGALPAGLHLNAGTGTISGTPTTAGTFSFSAKVLDAKSSSSVSNFTLNVSPDPSPTITGVSPNSGPTGGGTTVAISGGNFRAGAQVKFGNSVAKSTQIVDPKQIQAVSPPESNGSVDLIVENSDGQSVTAANAFTFVAPLQIATSSLPAGSVGTGYSSTLAAAGGVPPYSWSTTGGALPTGLQLNTSTGTITGVPSTAGYFSFTAKVLDAKASSSSSGLSVNVLADPPPTIAGVSPNSGPTDGGTSVTVTGNNFRSGAQVQFGDIAAASVQIVNPTQLQAVAPAEPGGVVDVTVQNSDGQAASAANVFTFTNAGSGTPPVVPAPSSDPLAPKIFNASSSSRAGDVGFIQGENFDGTSQAWLGGGSSATATELTFVNRSGFTWMAVQLPKSWTGAMVLWVSNSHGASKSVALNGAVASHLDALQLVPGGAFRILGRNLLMAGFTPVVTVDGQVATLNLNASDENMLVANAPSSLAPTAASTIMVDNGNGTGPVRLDRPISVVTGSGDPFGLGVGWGAGFTFASQIRNVSTPCDGTSDDTANIQAVINSAAVGGGVVQLPAGTCRLTSSLAMKSKVVLRGAGKDATVLRYEGNYPITSTGSDLVGIADFTVVNSGSVVEGPRWQHNTRSFIVRVKVDMGVSGQLFLTGNTNMVVSQSDFIQRGSIGGQNPYLFTSSAGLVFSGNATTSIDGSPTFKAVHDALFIGNHFTRDASNQNESTVIATHRFVMDFAYRIAVVGNTFDVTNGPVTNKSRNDGETLLTEGGGANRTENLGIVVSATNNSISDPSNTINVNPFGTALPENYGVAIVDGKGAGQTREVVGYANGVLQVDHGWDVIPDSTSHYSTFVWGLEKSLLKGNTLVDNPRGIWLYQTAIRDVDILANTITNGGGIYLRTFQSKAAKQFDPIYNVRIRDNKVGNSTGLWMSYLNVVFVNTDQTNFGVADIGIEIGNNSLSANTPNLISMTEDYAGREGFMNLMRSEASGGKLTTTPMVLGSIFQSNQCQNCSTAFTLGTGSYGAVLSHNQPTLNSPNFLADWKTLGSAIVGSIGTIVQ